MKSDTELIRGNKNTDNNTLEYLMDEVISQEEKIKKIKEKNPAKGPSPREQLRFNANFKPIETLSKEFAYHQFLCINDTLSKMQDIFFERYDWKDPQLVEKFEKKIRFYDASAEKWNDWAYNKYIFNIHPETMGQYIEFLKSDDYIWQLLSR